MALISCSECGKDVSDKAASCPNCSAPISGAISVSLNPKSHVEITRTGGKWEGIGFIFVVIGLITAIAGQGFGGLLMTVGFVIFIIGRFK